MKRICSVLSMLLLTSLAYSQNSNGSDESLIITIKPELGFSLGADYSMVQNFTQKDTFGIYPTTVNNAPGFRMGIFGDIKIQKRFTLMPKFELSLNNSTAEENNVVYSLNPAVLDFMLHGKFNFSKRPNKVNAYCAFGPGLSMPISDEDESFPTKRAWTGDATIGVDIELDRFYLSPEFRYGYGLTNISERESWEGLRGSYLSLNLLFTRK